MSKCDLERRHGWAAVMERVETHDVKVSGG